MLDDAREVKPETAAAPKANDKPETAAPPADGDSLTILTSTTGKLLTKQWFIGADGKPQLADYGHETHFSYQATEISGLDMVELLLAGLTRHQCLLFGRYCGSSPKCDLRRLHPRKSKDGQTEPRTIEPHWHHWLPLDIDDVSAADEKGEFDPAAEPERAVARVVKLLPPEFEGADVVWQLTSGAGFKKGIRLRLHYWLDHRMFGDEIRNWLAPYLIRPVEQGQEKDERRIIDGSIYSGVQPIYAAAPAFNGVADPVRRRTGFLRGRVRAVVAPPRNAAASTASTASGAARPADAPANVEFDGEDTLAWAIGILQQDLEQHGVPVVGNYSDNRTYRLVGELRDGPAYGKSLEPATIAELLQTHWAPHFDWNYLEHKVNGCYQNEPGCGPPGAQRVFGEAAQNAAAAAAIGTGDADTGEDLFDPWAKGSSEKAGWTLPATFPAVIGDFARDAAPRMGGRPVPLAFCSIAACAAAIHTGLRLAPEPYNPTFVVPPALWFGLNGESGTLKSPILKEAFRPLQDYEQERAKEHGAAFARWKREQLPWQLRQKDRQSGALRNIGDDVDLEPQEPCLRVFTRQNVTTEAVAARVARNGGTGLTLLPDELAAWIGSMDRYNTTKGADQGFWLTAYDGGALNMERKGGNIQIDSLVLGIAGGIQPALIAKMANELSDDGLLQRFNFCRTYSPNRPSEVMPDLQKTAAYRTLVRRLADLEPLVPNNPVTMSPEAFAIYRAVRDETFDRGKAVRRYMPQLGQHLDKYKGMLARITLIFHAIDSVCDPSAGNPLKPRLRPVVSGETARGAADFVREIMLPEAIEFYREAFDAGDREGDAHEIARWLVANEKQPAKIKPRDIARGVRRLMGNRRALQEAMHNLVEWSWAEPAEYGPGIVKEWWVHPGIWTRFASHIPIICRERAAAHEAMKAGGGP